ncbi:MAG TPA: methyltransferase domain-containing protein [Gemmatimonadaceae bacterium]
MPFVLEKTGATSVVDVGCGTGDWLRVTTELGISDILGVDFHDGGELNIPADRYLSHDLTKPLNLGRKFDLAMSLEVGEHLPPEAAKPFVELLTSLAPVVLYSAAIPGQGGTSHLNEQWPRYWAALFTDAGYTPIDCIRRQFWENDRVVGYYAQNALLYVRADLLNRYDDLRDLPSLDLLPVVHHGMYMDAVTELSKLNRLNSSRGLLKRLPGALWQSVATRGARLFSKDD